MATRKQLPSASLVGRLVVSKASGDKPWGKLEIPQALAQGLFSALSEPGVTMPEGRAHITVFTAEEIASIGSPAKITERGKQFPFRLGTIRYVNPAGWAEMERVWFAFAFSSDLEKLRVSYGLSPRIRGHNFHITFAVRRRGALDRVGSVSKAAAESAIRVPTLMERFTGPLKRRMAQVDRVLDYVPPTPSRSRETFIRQKSWWEKLGINPFPQILGNLRDNPAKRRAALNSASLAFSMFGPALMPGGKLRSMLPTRGRVWTPGWGNVPKSYGSAMHRTLQANAAKRMADTGVTAATIARNQGGVAVKLSPYVADAAAAVAQLPGAVRSVVPKLKKSGAFTKTAFRGEEYIRNALIGAGGGGLYHMLRERGKEGDEEKGSTGRAIRRMLTGATLGAGYKPAAGLVRRAVGRLRGEDGGGGAAAAPSPPAEALPAEVTMEDIANMVDEETGAFMPGPVRPEFFDQIMEKAPGLWYDTPRGAKQHYTRPEAARLADEEASKMFVREGLPAPEELDPFSKKYIFNPVAGAATAGGLGALRRMVSGGMGLQQAVDASRLSKYGLRFGLPALAWMASEPLINKYMGGEFGADPSQKYESLGNWINIDRALKHVSDLRQVAPEVASSGGVAARFASKFPRMARAASGVGGLFDAAGPAVAPGLAAVQEGFRRKKMDAAGLDFLTDPVLGSYPQFMRQGNKSMGKRLGFYATNPVRMWTDFYNQPAYTLAQKAEDAALQGEGAYGQKGIANKWWDMFLNRQVGWDKIMEKARGGNEQLMDIAKTWAVDMEPGPGAISEDQLRTHYGR